MKNLLMKKIFIRLTVIVLAVLFTFLILEIALRAVYKFRFPPKKKSAFSAVTTTYRLSAGKGLVYELKPGSGFEIKKRGLSIRINNSGFRDQNYSPAKSDKKRIIFIGDSITYGWGLNLQETYHKQLEALFRAKNKATEVMGMGVVGYNTVQEYYLTREKALEFNPDIVVLQICPNDFQRTLGIKKKQKGKSFRLIAYHDIAIPYILGKGSFSRFLMRNSHLYKFLNLKIDGFLKKLNKNHEADEYFLLGEDEAFLHLEKIKNLLDKEGIKFAAVIFPQKNKKQGYRYRTLHKKIALFLNRLKVPFIDLYESLNAKSAGNLWMDNIHPNKNGNRIAALELYNYLLPLLNNN